MYSGVKETATFVQAGAAVTVVSSVFKLINASSGIGLLSTDISLNTEGRQK